MKKAQAAMEYLVTYGWAIIIIVVVLGVLAGLALKPQAQQYCLFDKKGIFTCKPDFLVVKYDGKNWVYLSFIYNGYDRIKITDLACAKKGEDYKIRLLGNAELGGKEYYSSGSEGKIVSLNCGYNEGEEYFEGVVVLKYTKAKGGSYQLAIANIRTKISEKN